MAFQYQQSHLKCSLFFTCCALFILLRDGGCYYELFLFLLWYIYTESYYIRVGHFMHWWYPKLPGIWIWKLFQLVKLTFTKENRMHYLSMVLFFTHVFIKMIWCFILSVATTVHFVVVVKINNQDKQKYSLFIGHCMDQHFISVPYVSCDSWCRTSHLSLYIFLIIKLYACTLYLKIHCR